MKSLSITVSFIFLSFSIFSQHPISECECIKAPDISNFDAYRYEFNGAVKSCKSAEFANIGDEEFDFSNAFSTYDSLTFNKKNQLIFKFKYDGLLNGPNQWTEFIRDEKDQLIEKNYFWIPNSGAAWQETFKPDTNLITKRFIYEDNKLNKVISMSFNNGKISTYKEKLYQYFNDDCLKQLIEIDTINNKKSITTSEYNSAKQLIKVEGNWGKTNYFYEEDSIVRIENYKKGNLSKINKFVHSDDGSYKKYTYCSPNFDENNPCSVLETDAEGNTYDFAPLCGDTIKLRKFRKNNVIVEQDTKLKNGVIQWDKRTETTFHPVTQEVINTKQFKDKKLVKEYRKNEDGTTYIYKKHNRMGIPTEIIKTDSFVLDKRGNWIEKVLKEYVNGEVYQTKVTKRIIEYY